MSQSERLKPLAGIYKQNDGNTFVVALNDESLFLKTDEIHGEKLVPRGDGLYDVENTGAKIKFHLSPNGGCHSLTFYLKDRQTVATRDLAILKETSLLQKFSELGIAIVVFFSLIGIFFLSYNPLKNACLKGGNPTVCRFAALSARLMGRQEDGQKLSNEELKHSYTQSNEQNESSCQEGEASACLEVAKSQARIGNNPKVVTLLTTACYEKKHAPSCQFWHDWTVEQGNVEEADLISQKGCELGVAISCYDRAWKFKKNKKDNEALTYFDKACSQGEEKSCYELALHHLKFNRDRSFQYVTKACRNYHRQACELKEKLDEYFAQKKLCQEEKSPRACFLMASFEYDYGDREKAYQEYIKACEMNYHQACNVIKRLEKIKDIKDNKQKTETI